jgi:hypothetical protein
LKYGHLGRQELVVQPATEPSVLLVPVLGKGRTGKGAICKEEIVSSMKYKPYCELGKVLDNLARTRDVRGPYNIAHEIQNATGYEVSGQAVSQYVYGRSSPKREFIEAFAEAFELTPQERGELAWVYAYGFRPEDERLMIVKRKRHSDVLS